MNNWTIKKRIIFGFVTLFILVGLMASVTYFLTSGVKERIESIETKSLPGLEGIMQTQINQADAQMAVLRVLMAKNVEDQKKYQGEIDDLVASNNKILEQYSKFLDKGDKQKLFDALAAVRKENGAARSKLLEMVNSGRMDEALVFVPELRKIYLRYQDALGALVKCEKEIANADTNEASAMAGNITALTLVVATAVIVIGVIFASIIVVGLNKALVAIAKSLNDGAMQVSGASSQVSASSQSLAEGASEQAASIEETSASLTELSSTIERNAQSAGETKQLAEQTRLAAQQGARNTQEMDASIASIKSASSEMGEAMNAIKSASNDISNIIKTIDEIAFQTNLLALNAAVEAARAGEAGAGFAVVADEVRNLAQRSAKAAKETAGMIETAVQRSELGVQTNSKVSQAVEDVVAKSTEVSKQLEEIVGKVEQVDEQITQIATASKEQSQGINQVSTAVNQMEKVTQSNASGAEESAAASEELNSQAEVLKETVRELQKLVG